MADRKLRRRERMTRRRDIDRAFSEGVRCRRGCLAVRAVRNGLDYSRLGVGVGSKLCNSVKRNRLKRLAREAFRLNKDSIPVGLDVFVMHTKVDATYTEVERDLIDVTQAAQKKLREESK